MQGIVCVERIRLSRMFLDAIYILLRCDIIYEEPYCVLFINVFRFYRIDN